MISREDRERVQRAKVVGVLSVAVLAIASVIGVWTGRRDYFGLVVFIGVAGIIAATGASGRTRLP